MTYISEEFHMISKEKMKRIINEHSITITYEKIKSNKSDHQLPPKKSWILSTMYISLWIYSDRQTVTQMKSNHGRKKKSVNSTEEIQQRGYFSP